MNENTNSASADPSRSPTATKPRQMPRGPARRSFAQMEWDVAEPLAKPRYALLAGDDCPFDNADASPAPREKFKLQRRHRQAVAGARARELWHTFNSREEMEKLVRGIDFPTIAPQRLRKPRVDLLWLARDEKLDQDAALFVGHLGAQKNHVLRNVITHTKNQSNPRLAFISSTTQLTID